MEPPCTDERRARLMLVLLALLPFCLSLLNGFVYDDHFFVKGNRWLHDWANLWLFLSDPVTNADGIGGYQANFWRPFRNLSFAIDYTITGDRPAWYHAVNLVWHLAAVQGAWSLMRRIGFSCFVCFVAAGIFACHPAQTESVVWIKERDGLMCGALLLWALYFAAGDKVWCAIASVVLYVLAQASKESAIVFLAAMPMVLLAAHRFRGRDWRLADGIAWGLSLLLALVYLYTRHHVLGASGQRPTPMGGTAGATAWTMLGVYGRYLAMFLWPARLHITFEWIEVSGPGDAVAWIGLGLLVATGVAIVACYRRHPGIAFGLAWFLVALAPYSQALPMVQWLAVRFMYIPLLGLAIAFSVVLESLTENRTIRYRGLPMGSTITVLLLGVLSYRSMLETLVWRSDLTLWRREYRLEPDTPRTMAMYSDHLKNAGDFEEAIEVGANFPYEGTMEFADLAGKARIESLEGAGRDAEALAFAREMAARLPGSVKILVPLGLVELRHGDRARGIDAWERALELDPANLNVLRNLIMAYGGPDKPGRGAQLARYADTIETTPRESWPPLPPR